MTQHAPYREAPADEAVSVVLADAAFLSREAVAHVLDEADGVRLVAVCRDRFSLLSAIRRERPAVAVVASDLPPAETAVAEELQRRHPDLGVIELSERVQLPDETDLVGRHTAGHGFLLKQQLDESRQLTAAIDVVAQGGAYVDAAALARLRAARSLAERSPLAELSTREREVLALVAEGKSNASIAAELVLTKRAVEKHINAIFLKLGLRYETDVSRRVMATLIHQSATQEEP